MGKFLPSRRRCRRGGTKCERFSSPSCKRHKLAKTNCATAPAGSTGRRRRGGWEGNPLVVDVTNFTAKTDFLGSRENLHLIERWTRRDGNTLEYVVTIEDPTAWAKPWTVKQEMQRQSEQANRIYYEPRCHE